jgi:hypothetical protein
MVGAAEWRAGIDFGEKAGEVMRGVVKQSSTVDGRIENAWGGLTEIAGAEICVANVGGAGGCERGCAEKVRGENLNVRAAFAGRMEVEREAAEIDHERLQSEFDAGVAGSGVDEFLVPGAADKEDEFGETGGADGGGDFAELFVGAFWIEAEKRGWIRRESKTQRWEHEQRQRGFRELRRGFQQSGSGDFFGVEGEAETMVGEAVDGQDDHGTLALGQGGEVSPSAMGPGGVGIGVGEPGGAHELIQARNSRGGRERDFAGLVSEWADRCAGAADCRK